MTALSEYVQMRPRLLAVAYHVTGSRADAEDVVQEAWEKWSRVDEADVHSGPAFLTTMVSRLSLNAVRARERRRESYVGPWLPDPILDTTPEWEVVQREGLGQALDVVLSSMSPTQACAYVLRKVLDVDYDDIADVLETTATAARQQVSRAQRAVSERLGELDPDRRRESDRRALDVLAAAVIGGDIAVIASLLSPDSVLYSDGGGKANAALRPIFGSEKIARFLLGIVSGSGNMQAAPAVVSGGSGSVFWEDGSLSTTVTVRVADGVITDLYLMRNPDKLPNVSPAGWNAIDISAD